MVPDDGRGTERDDAAALLETPAEINVIASGVIFRIEAADIFKAQRQNAMLQPGMCSATVSVNRT